MGPISEKYKWADDKNVPVDMSSMNAVAEVFAAIAVGILTALFLSAFFVLIVICKRSKFDYISYFYKTKKTFKDVPRFLTKRSDEMILYKSKNNNFDKSEMEIGSLCMTENFDKIIGDQQWLDDVSGLIPHCLAVLKICRSLTERLTALTMGAFNNNPEGLRQIVDSAKKISTRVDEMVKSMYPPLNPQMLEARASSLMMAVTHLALLAQYECRNKKIPMEWIGKAMEEMETHINILREASSSFDTMSTSTIFPGNTVTSTTFNI